MRELISADTRHRAALRIYYRDSDQLASDMEHKIFLGKYRVAGDEIALAATEPASLGVAAATEQVTTARTYRGQEIESGRDVTVEVIRVGAFKPSAREKLEAEASAFLASHP